MISHAAHNCNDRVQDNEEEEGVYVQWRSLFETTWHHTVAIAACNKLCNRIQVYKHYFLWRRCSIYYTTREFRTCILQQPGSTPTQPVGDQTQAIGTHQTQAIGYGKMRTVYRVNDQHIRIEMTLRGDHSMRAAIRTVFTIEITQQCAVCIRRNTRLSCQFLIIDGVCNLTCTSFLDFSTLCG